MLGRKLRRLAIALIIVAAFCMAWRAVGIDRATLDVPNLIPPPLAGGCPPAYSTAAALGARDLVCAGPLHRALLRRAEPSQPFRHH
jgi:hypothetical protein